MRNASPSEIAGSVGRGKYSVRGWIQRVYERGGHRTAVVVVRRCMEDVLSLSPLMVPAVSEDEGLQWFCKLCCRTVMRPLQHILSTHSALLEAYTERVASRCLNGRAGKA